MERSERINGWEREYLSDAFNVINKREREILEGSPLKSNEGMVYGRMYAEWKAHNEIDEY
tara:strand:+ start:759 stop:938 length:180 start_codon:yes stop_codon:yes gene_type:complete